MNTMNALFRIPFGKGRYLAIFINMIVLEYYSLVTDEMINGQLIASWKGFNMSKSTIAKVCFALGFIVLATVVATSFHNYKMKVAYRASVQFINTVDDETLVQFMVHDAQNYKLLADKVMKFEPETADDYFQKLEAMKKMVRCLEAAVNILHDMMILPNLESDPNSV